MQNILNMRYLKKKRIKSQIHFKKIRNKNREVHQNKSTYLVSFIFIIYLLNLIKI